jgi:hypothetical protein
MIEQRMGTIDKVTRRGRMGFLTECIACLYYKEEIEGRAAGLWNLMAWWWRLCERTKSLTIKLR